VITSIERRRVELAELCRRYRVKRLVLFGSAARGTFQHDSSDLDFIVAFEGAGERGYATRYYEFAESLEALLGRRVDLLTERMIGNPYFPQEVQQTRETVYEQGGPAQSHHPRL
jgi:predicted nucleotidyltransferase